MKTQNEFDLEKKLEKHLSRKIQMPDENHFKLIQSKVWEELNQQPNRKPNQTSRAVWFTSLSIAASLTLLFLVFNPFNKTNIQPISESIPLESKSNPQPIQTEEINKQNIQKQTIQEVAKSEVENWILQSEPDLNRLIAILDESNPLEPIIPSQLSPEDLENFILENQHDIYLP